MATSTWKLSVAGALALVTLASTAGAQERAPSTLPLKAVRLYEVGLGYFERTGKLGNRSEVALPVPATHLDDALKTLVVLGEGGKATVTGVEFASSVSPSMGRALAGLPEGEELVTYPKLLQSLKGASVELRTGQETLRGRLIDVVEPAQAEVAECQPARAGSGERASGRPEAGGEAGAVSACAAARHLTLLLLTDRGEVRRLRSAEVVGVRPTDPAFAARLGSGLDATSPQGGAARRPLRVMASSTAPVTLGYVAETPVWRSSYRLLLDDAGGGVLQGWALVHNDTDEAWKQVRVELVNGQPASFLFPLAAPRYGRRELVTPDEALSTVPQLHGRTVDSMWGDEESHGASGFGLTGVGHGGGGRGYGIGLGGVGTIGKAVVHGAGASTALSVGNLAAIVQADGVESGVLFRYVLPEPIDLRAHGSALVPFVQRAVSARRIAHFESPGAAARSAARLRNDTGQTLPAGPIAFFADGGFAGEATVDRLIPNDRRTVVFGTDLDVELERHKASFRDEPRLVVFEHGALVEHYVRFHRVTYAIINKSQSPRTVFVNLDYVMNSRVEGADELDYDSESRKAMAIFQVEAKAQPVRELKVEEGLRRSYSAQEWSSKRLASLAAVTTLPAGQRAALRAAAAEMQVAEQRRDALPKVQESITSVVTELQRLRGYLSAAKGDSEGVERFTKRILATEDRLASLRAQAEQLVKERKQRAALAVASLKQLTGAAAAR
ncbi:hypothetical protein [Chondromyces crocatus]|uniref:DUF4139 domain-containing protein n=1 Tax=Chondromyces crocatus TaxID=52 RepID=A0A0K1ET37_CHOCO|nr:hypothetical protein [Chondromyces crocatus]AKT44070.1 uncharacterized protein CMC5_083080 [Chondromyces crocatus]